jgi:RimJ/RimL family protein N-acetyltransferase
VVSTLPDLVDQPPQSLRGVRLLVADLELGYRVFDRAKWGKGIASAAVDLFAAWLFDTQPTNRLRLLIHVDNLGSHRVAEKCGFTNEGRSREAWYHKGKRHDVDVYTLTRAESDRRRKDRGRVP